MAWGWGIQLLELKIERAFGPSSPVVSISGQTLWGQTTREPLTLSIQKGVQASIV